MTDDGRAVAAFGAKTSAAAGRAVGVLLAGYFSVAVVAGAPNSPFTVLLPSGVSPPSWAHALASTFGLDQVGRPVLIGMAWVLVPVVLGAFVVVVREAWAQRLSLPVVLVASAVSLAIAALAPLLLSRDVYTYAAYGRIRVLYHHNPYVSTLAAFPHDPFVAVASSQWRHTHAPYGPAFTLLSAAMVRIWEGSAGGTIVAFKILGALAVAIATGCVAFTARRTQPHRAALAAALIGLNPVIVIHTVGGGHVDALIAAPLAAAMAIAVTNRRALTFRALAVTVLLTGAFLIKSVMLPVLALWLLWLARDTTVGRARVIALHLAVVAVLVAAAASPFGGHGHAMAPFATLGGLEQWASPSQLVAHGAHAIVGWLVGSQAAATASAIVKWAFGLVYVLLFWRLARRTFESPRAGPADQWGVALLLLALSMPFLLPWYAAWYAPFLGLMADDLLVAAGTITTVVLALTLVPADPFHGYSTPGVMNGVHYAAAPALLVVLVVVAGRVLGLARAAPRWPEFSQSRREDHDVDAVSR